MDGRPIAFRTDLSWDHIDWLRSVTALPIVLKGIVHPQDARSAVERGVDAVAVSNHGGRQLDTVPATIELLPPVADAIGGTVPLLLDGGVRRGTGRPQGLGPRRGRRRDRASRPVGARGGR